MNLLDNLKKIEDAPKDIKEIIIVFHNERLEHSKYRIRLCYFQNNEYWYVNDVGFTRKVQKDSIVGWCFL